MDGAEPEGGEERGEGDPNEPRLVEGGEGKNEQETAQGGGEPGPEIAEKRHARKQEKLTAEGAEGTEKGAGLRHQRFEISDFRKAEPLYLPPEEPKFEI
jgi:hypothetical protein